MSHTSACDQVCSRSLAFACGVNKALILAAGCCARVKLTWATSGQCLSHFSFVSALARCEEENVSFFLTHSFSNRELSSGKVRSYIAKKGGELAQRQLLALPTLAQ